MDETESAEESFLEREAVDPRRLGAWFVGIPLNEVGGDDDGI